MATRKHLWVLTHIIDGAWGNLENNPYCGCVVDDCLQCKTYLMKTTNVLGIFENSNNVLQTLEESIDDIISYAGAYREDDCDFVGYSYEDNREIYVSCVGPYYSAKEEAIDIMEDGMHEIESYELNPGDDKYDSPTFCLLSPWIANPDALVEHMFRLDVIVIEERSFKKELLAKIACIQ